MGTGTETGTGFGGKIGSSIRQRIMKVAKD